jgi:lipopolysaccharide export system permease protein
LERDPGTDLCSPGSTIYKTEVRKKQQKSLLGTADIWMRGSASFVNVDDFDPATNTLHGVTVFLLNRDFTLRGLVEIPAAKWNGRIWEAVQATEWRVPKDGKVLGQKTTDGVPISDSPEDLKLLARDADAFSYFDLQKQIADMRSKGMDATRYEVDLQSKLALPLISPLVVLIAIPFALKRQMSGSMALSFGVAMLIAFGYWVLAAFCTHSVTAPRCRRGCPHGFQCRIFAMIGSSSLPLKNDRRPRNQNGVP